MKERLQLLQQAAVISAESANRCHKISKLIETRLKADTENEQFQMLIIHLAHAFDRITNGVPIEHGMDDEMFAEIMMDPIFPQVDIINCEIIQVMNIVVPKAENSFFLSNLLSLYYSEIGRASCRERV